MWSAVSLIDQNGSFRGEAKFETREEAAEYMGAGGRAGILSLALQSWFRRPLVPEHFSGVIFGLDCEGRGSSGEVAEAEIRIFRNRNPSIHAKQQCITLPHNKLLDKMRWDIEQGYLIALQPRIVGMPDHDLRLPRVGQ